MRDYPAHEDLGLVDDDHTPDMRKAPVAADALRNNNTHHSARDLGDSTMTSQGDNNQYPVDSATRACCGGIGRHTRDCDINLPVPNFPIPAGATADDWPSITDDGVQVRSVLWSEHKVDSFGVSVWGMQYGDDGRVEPEISIFGPQCQIDTVPADDARRLAAKLLTAADELDRLRAAL